MAVAAVFVADESGSGRRGVGCNLPDHHIFTDAIIGRNIARNAAGGGYFLGQRWQ